MILLPMCRNILKVIRPKIKFLPLDESQWFHRQVAYSMLIWTIVHVCAHYVKLVHFVHPYPTQLLTFAAFSMSKRAKFALLQQFKYTTQRLVVSQVILCSCACSSCTLPLMRRFGSNLSRRSGIPITFSSPSYLDYTRTPLVVSFETHQIHSHHSTMTISGAIVLDIKVGDGSYGEVGCILLNVSTVRFVHGDRLRSFVLSAIHMVRYSTIIGKVVTNQLQMPWRSSSRSLL